MRTAAGGTPTIERLQDALIAGQPGGRGELLACFARELHARTGPSYFSRFTLEQLQAAVVSMFDWLDESSDERIRIRVLTPPWLETVSGIRQSVIEVTGPDQPFLVDTLRELMQARAHPLVELFHPILSVRRDARGRIAELRGPEDGDNGRLTSFMHFETEELLPEDQSRELEEEAGAVFADTRQVVLDFEAMTETVRTAAARLRERMKEAEDARTSDSYSEVIGFLEWLLRGNFVFLGTREYRIQRAPEGRAASVVRGSGLGVLRDEERSSLWQPRRLADLDPDVRRRLAEPELLAVQKTNSESTVLRRTNMDYIAVKFIGGDGEVLGEQRFLGLFTARALGELPANVPVLRRKLDQILKSARVVPGSHDDKQIFSVFCSLPKAQLFLYDAEALGRLIFEVMDQRDREGVRVRYYHDPLGRSVSAMVLMPRERFNAPARHAIQRLLAEQLRGSLVEYHLTLTDEPMARLHFYFATGPGESPRPPLARLDAEVTRLTKTWEECASEILQEKYGLKAGLRLAAKYMLGFPPSYSAQEPPESVVTDIDLLEDTLSSAGGLRVRVTGMPGKTRFGRETGRYGQERPEDRRDGTRYSVLRIARARESFHLSRLMPTLTHLSLEVLDESSYAIQGPGLEQPVHLHAFRVVGPDGQVIPGGRTSRSLEEAILAILQGEAADDSLNGLVAITGMTWRQVDVLRTYTMYFQQLEGALRQRTAYLTLRRLPRAADALLDLFEGRFAPDLSPAEREERQHEARRRLEAVLNEVQGIQEDRLLRGYESLILATLRTNYFQRADDGRPRPTLAIKIRCAGVPFMPQPRPLFEIFMANCWMEGIHLRSGKVSRGGIRWSDRTDDFRTEILGLMKSQRTKNALIVPVGAKGGFVLRRGAAAKRSAGEVQAQYESYIGALLDLTDNVVDGREVRPPQTVTYDEPDPYLVVAADRGTAQFSDLANRIARGRSFWLGDAFASGGSTGFNHKEHGITARGAWECVKLHFRALGADVQTEEFTVAGIGDMSGDVFGNAMLLSRQIQLVAAFNDRHIFLDPSPDPEVSYRERERLFRMPRSSWDDYARELISRGGGVFPRDSKRILLSTEARELLEVQADALNGDELIRAILALPVDLLWNGGIGTYVKASAETHFEVGDPANDPVRVNAAEVRARVIGEGGNLGITPQGRVEFARRGGRVNTDFIDNSAGVDLSDHEVNLKILLDGALRSGAVSPGERDRLLKEIAPEVCEQVLRDNRLQSEAISVERRRDVSHLAQIRLLVRELEATGLLNRHLEAVPEPAEFDRLLESSMGLTRPQLSVLLAYSKIDAYSRVIEADLADDPALFPYLITYFPRGFAERFREEIEDHPLRREITVTAAVNECINRMGVTFLHRLAREESRRIPSVLRAYVAASRLNRSDEFHSALETSGDLPEIPVAALEDARIRYAGAVESLVRWCLRRGGLAEGDGSPGWAERFDAARALLTTQDRGAEEGGPASSPLGDAVVRQLSSAAQSEEAAEVARLADRERASLEAARLALEVAGERLLDRTVGEEASRIVKNSANDWQMCSSLTAKLRDLRLDLARRILAAVEDEERASTSPSREKLCARADRLVPDSDPLRRRAQEVLDRSHQQPLLPSGLYVLVESLGRLLSR